MRHHNERLGTPRRLAVVMTGGTIASTVAAGVAGIDRAALDSACRQASEAVAPLGMDVVCEVPFLAHSEEVVPHDWVRLAAAIRSLAAHVEGVLVLHGTDTAAYTSAALSYLLVDVDLPVVVTGSAVPWSLPGSDAEPAVRGASLAAACLPAGAYLACAAPGGEVGVFLGTRVRKVRVESPPFAGVGRDPVALVEDGRVSLVSPPVDGGRVGPTPQVVDDRVQVVGCHPGAALVDLAEWAVRGGMRGLVLVLYPGMTAPTGRGRHSAEEAVRRATAAGLVVAAIGGGGCSAPTATYPSTLALEAAGAALLPLPVEAALPKLMWACAHADDPAAVADLLRTPVRGDLLGGRGRPG